MTSLVGLASCPPSLLWYVFLLLLFLFNQSSSTFLYISNIEMKHLCQVGPVAGALIDPPRFPWSIYTNGLDGFARERPISCNTNVMGYPFHDGTWAVSSLSFLFPFVSCTSQPLS